MDAFSAIAIAIDANNINDANSMLKIVAKSIREDKKNSTFSSYIEVTKKEVFLFKKVMPLINIYDNDGNEEAVK